MSELHCVYSKRERAYFAFNITMDDAQTLLAGMGYKRITEPESQPWPDHIAGMWISIDSDKHEIRDTCTIVKGSWIA